MKRYISVALLLLALPVFVDAAWWNPSTWNDPVVVEKVVERIVEVPVEKIVEKEVERPVDRIVTKTVQVDNPKLKIEIDNLKKQNADLVSKLARLSSATDELTMCKAELVATNSKLGSEDNKCAEAKGLYKTLTDKKYALETEKLREVEKRRTASGGSTSGMSAEIALIRRKYDVQLEPLFVEISRANRDMELYCK